MGRERPSHGKTREGVPYSVFFEGRRSLGSRRLKCSGFGLQHLWFCYKSMKIGSSPAFQRRLDWRCAWLAVPGPTEIDIKG
jgi:hypothetical protein